MLCEVIIKVTLILTRVCRYLYMLEQKSEEVNDLFSLTIFRLYISVCACTIFWYPCCLYLLESYSLMFQLLMFQKIVDVFDSWKKKNPPGICELCLCVSLFRDFMTVLRLEDQRYWHISTCSSLLTILLLSGWRWVDQPHPQVRFNCSWLITLSLMYELLFYKQENVYS